MLLVPDFKCNLISIYKLTYDLNSCVIYNLNSCTIHDKASKRKIGSGDLHEGVYVLTKQHQKGFTGAAKKDMITLWHIRIGHSSNQVLQHISHLVECNFDRENCCDVCHKAKQYINSFPLSINKAEAPFKFIHYDLWGKYHTATNNG